MRLSVGCNLHAITIVDLERLRKNILGKKTTLGIAYIVIRNLQIYWIAAGVLTLAVTWL